VGTDGPVEATEMLSDRMLALLAQAERLGLPDVSPAVVWDGATRTWRFWPARDRYAFHVIQRLLAWKARMRDRPRGRGD
jgi:hypothetical protein